MTAKRRAALRKAQLASARKRKKSSRRKKVAVGIVAGVAVGSVLGYRAYDKRVEIGQRKHLEHKAWNARLKLPMEFDEDILRAQDAKPHKQPRRYAKRPASQQTKLSIAQHRKTVLGKAVSRADRVITTPAPYQVKIKAKRHSIKQSGPRFQHVGLSRTHVFGARVGNTRASLSVRRTKRKR